MKIEKTTEEGVNKTIREEFENDEIEKKLKLMKNEDEIWKSVLRINTVYSAMNVLNIV